MSITPSPLVLIITVLTPPIETPTLLTAVEEDKPSPLMDMFPPSALRFPFISTPLLKVSVEAIFSGNNKSGVPTAKPLKGSEPPPILYFRHWY